VYAKGIYAKGVIRECRVGSGYSKYSRLTSNHIPALRY
jgi:hypothetical protein